jgi:K+-transporting ATPase ATPase A chain
VTALDLAQYAFFVLLITLPAPLLGHYLARVYQGERVWLSPLIGPLERGLYRLAGVDPTTEQGWAAYARGVLAVSVAGFLALYSVLRLQGLLPWNPQGLPGVSPARAFNTAVSFVTNTNWQAYSGEVALSYFSQMVGLTVQNFVSAALGMAVAMALFRGLARKTTQSIGNIYVDLTRGLLYVLLPLAIPFALLLIWQGVPQTLGAYVSATGLEGAQQTLAVGPAASQIAIKQLGTNGGGFFGVNSAHPFENPTAVTNLLQVVAILLLPAAFPFAFGRMVGDVRQGTAIFSAMMVLFVGGMGLAAWAERQPIPACAELPVDQSAGNLEGKEARFGVGGSTLWALATTAASNGSVNAMHDSLSPLGGLVAMVNMMLGEVVFGGVGAGMYGMILFVVLTVFLAGLMVGRTPEYLGKKIEAREVKHAVLALLVTPLGVLVLGALAAVLPAAVASIGHPGPHGLSRVLYAYASATGNNGSAFAGFAADTPYQNTLLGLAMLAGRYVPILALLAIAGSLASKKTVPAGSGTFPTDGPLFVTLLVVVVLMVGGITFFPALALGPIAEHLAMLEAALF